MTNGNKKVSLAITSLLALFLFNPAVKAGSIETLRAQNPLAGLNLAAVHAYRQADLPAPLPEMVPAAGPAAAAGQSAALPASPGGDRVAQPDWSYSPGNLCTPTDPNFKEYRYPEHIAYCNRFVTKEMKLQVAAHYNIPQSDWPKYEFDHLIPLGIGGDSSIDNLWPQPRGGSDSDGKDRLENELYNQLAAGSITQKAAVQRIYAWFKGYAASHPELPQAVQARLAALGN